MTQSDQREKKRKYAREYYYRNQEAMIEKDRKRYRSLTPQEKKARNLRGRYRTIERKYGLSKTDYDKLIDKQNNRCDICSSPFDDKDYQPSVDHCHTTGKIRAILCRGCNSGMGHFKDNSERLRSAADYIDRHSI